METNKKLQNLIGKILNKDYSKYETECSCPSRENITVIPEPTLNDVLLAIQEKISALQPTKDKGIVCIWTKKSEPIYIDLEKSIFNQEESVKVKIINLLEDK